MPRTLLAAAFALALVGVACSEPPHPELDLRPEGTAFVPELVDFVDDVGLNPELALDPDGNPFVAYFGFPAQLAEGEIATLRPVGAPTVPGVLLAAKLDGIWNRGGVATAPAQGRAVTPPFGPERTEDVADLAPADATGVGVTFDDDGAAHVAWSTADGVWYATNASGSFSVREVARAAATGASVAVDQQGNPFLSYASQGQVWVATEGGGPRWNTDAVDRAAEGTSTAIGWTGASPTVAYTDGSSALAATVVEGRWNTERIGSGGASISMSVDGRGNPHVAFLDGSSVVAARRLDGGGWRTSEVAGGADDGSSVGIATEEDGIEFVTWVDAGTASVKLASNTEGGFTQLDVTGTRGGQDPTVAVTGDGATAFLAWYDAENGNLEFGTFGEVGSIGLAQPSPTPTSAVGDQPTEPGPATCEPDGTELVIAAPVGASGTGFDKDCLAAPAGEDFTIDFDNQDEGVQHNVAIYPSAEQLDPSFFVGELITGPDQILYEADAIADAREYFFRCDVHPITMTGTFVVG